MNAELNEQLEGLKKRAFFSRLISAFVALASVLLAVMVVLFDQGQLYDDAFYFEDLHIIDYLTIVYAIALFASFVAVGMWIHRAHKNLHTADFPALEFTPGWSVGWYAIPIANLFKPFQAMRELWNASHGAVGDYEQPAPGILWVWWLTWIFSGVSSWGETLNLVDAVGFALTSVSAVTLILIINSITAAQPTMSISSTFD